MHDCLLHNCLLHHSNAANTENFESGVERAIHNAIRSLLNLGNSIRYELCLAMASMGALEQRRIEQSRILFLNSCRLEGPYHIFHSFTPRVTKNNLSGIALNTELHLYDSLFLQNSFSYMIAHIRNKLPSTTKSASTQAFENCRVLWMPVQGRTVFSFVFTFVGIFKF